MTNVIHKVKDAVAGHHHSESKGASQGSSISTDQRKATSETHGASNTDPYAAIGHGIHHDPVSPTAKETLITHDPISAMSGTIDRTTTDTSKRDMGSQNSGIFHDSTHISTDVDTHRTRIIHAGPHGSKMVNKLDPRVDSDLDHREAPGGKRTTSSHQIGTYRSNYDTTGPTTASIPTLRTSSSDPLGSHSPAHGTRSAHTDMGSTMDNHEGASLPGQKA